MSRTFHEHTLYCLHPDSACTGFQVMPDGHKYGKLQADLLQRRTRSSLQARCALVAFPSPFLARCPSWDPCRGSCDLEQAVSARGQRSFLDAHTIRWAYDTHLTGFGDFDRLFTMTRDTSFSTSCKKCRATGWRARCMCATACMRRVRMSVRPMGRLLQAQDAAFRCRWDRKVLRLRPSVVRIDSFLGGPA